MGKSLKYGEFSFAAPKQRPTTGSYRSTKGISKATYDQPHAMKAGGYAKGGAKSAPKPVKREPEAIVRKEVALLKKAGAPKAIVEHEVREMKAPAEMKKGGKACYAEGGKVKMQKKVGKVMSEFKEGTLHSGKEGPVVKNPKQAIAIALSEGRKAVKKAGGGQITEGERAARMEKDRASADVLSELSRKYGSAITEGERARATQGMREMDAIKRAQMADEAMRQNMTEGERARMKGPQNYATGGSVESKLKKHASMPASQAHGPGAAAKLKKGGVPTFSKVPKIGQMK